MFLIRFLMYSFIYISIHDYLLYSLSYNLLSFILVLKLLLIRLVEPLPSGLFSFWHTSSFFEHFFVSSTICCSRLTFKLAPVIFSGKWYLEAKIGALLVLIALGVLLHLAFLVYRGRGYFYVRTRTHSHLHLYFYKYRMILQWYFWF